MFLPKGPRAPRPSALRLSLSLEEARVLKSALAAVSEAARDALEDAYPRPYYDEDAGVRVMERDAQTLQARALAAPWAAALALADRLLDELVPQTGEPSQEVHLHPREVPAIVHSIHFGFSGPAVEARVAGRVDELREDGALSAEALADVRATLLAEERALPWGRVADRILAAAETGGG